MGDIRSDIYIAIQDSMPKGASINYIKWHSMKQKKSIVKEINKMLKEKIIKKRKDPKDKRQNLYYFSKKVK